MRFLSTGSLPGKNRLKQLLVQFVKFGLVGISNTAISYGIEMLGFYVLFARNTWPEHVKMVVVTALGFVISEINSYYWNNRYVFSDPQRSNKKAHLRAFLKMTACYAFTGLLISPVLKITIHDLGIPFWAASLFTLIVTVPLNFVINKFWAFRRSKQR